MRKLLLFFVMLTVSVGTWAAEFTWTSDDGEYTVTASNVDNDYQKLVVNKPGALAAFVEATKDLSDSDGGPLKGVGGNSTRVKLQIEGELDSSDLSALNSTEVERWGTFTTLDLKNATIDDLSVITSSSMNMGGLNYMRLPDGMTSESDVASMASLKGSNNPNLKMVGAYDGSDSTLPELALYSFAENEVSNFSNQLMNVADLAMVARLAGTYGDKDLLNGGGPVFGWTPPCIWDFTGATFTACTVNPGIEVEYYAYNDPFRDGGTSKPGENYQTNAFYYFTNYATRVVDIKLPTGMTELPPRSIYRLGQQNVEKDVHKAAYKAYYGVDDAYITANLSQEFPNCVVIPDLIIPDNYVKLDYECGFGAHVKHLVVGSGTKIVEGAAFSDCLELEDLDFGAGLNNCYLGDRAFKGQSNSRMKHIALSEGIVSLGNYCFQNAQHLESIRLPQSLIDIGCNAFDNCLALNSITIPENVDKIGMDAFRLCPFTDIYLTTTDPEKIPIVFTGGNSFDGWGSGASFHHGHYDGWEGMSGVHAGSDPDGFTWDEAAEWYYVHVNGLPVLHYPKQLADKVRADISASYHGHSSDSPSLGLPTAADMHARETAGGADVGTRGQGIYTRDGWAQFMLMKEFTTDPGGDVYTKKYEDVWYTMCFPFDLSDEQLAAAFNETFNIVDFSGVEVKEADEEAGTPKKLVLHFNKVAKTYYRDNEGNEYEVIGREVDPTSKFEYNIYQKDGVTYHHSTVSSQLSTNKTKTFAPGNSIAESNANKDNAVIIDGVLATAGHPYMIHPAIGTSIGDPKRCDFSGISWKPMTQWANIFEAQKRVVDLGVAKGTINEDDFKQSTPDADNYTQAAYSKYAGQTYTFIGNAKEYRDDAQDAIGDEPQVPEEPTEPVAPSEPTETLTEPTETLTEPEALTADEQELLSLLTDGQDQYNRGPWYGITAEITASYNDGSDAANNYNSRFHIIQNKISELGYNVWGGDAEAAFNHCKTVFNKSINYATEYAAYQANQAEWNAYNANQAAWNAYNTYDPATAQAEYEAALAAYNTAKATHDAWEATAKAWLTYIPKHSYFLGRRGTALPKYYRETAEDPAEGQASTRTGGVWTQFTAIVIPNDAAISGIEGELDGKTASSKGFDMAFDEGFLGDVIDEDDVVTLIEKAQAEGAKVEYMDIVVSINGQVVRRGTTSVEGLPKGVYIVNGKKYFVK